MKKLIAILFCLTGCIGQDVIDDEVPEKIIINNPITSLKVGDTYTFSARYLNNIGQEENVDFSWSSSAPSVISIDNSGLAEAKTKGEVTITASYKGIFESFELEAGEATSGGAEQRTADLKTVSSYPLSGTATLKQSDTGLTLELADDFTTTSDLPGLYVYLSNNTNTLNGALEIAKVAKFSGAQTYTVPQGTDLFEYNIVLFYCKPFVVPVGNGSLNP